MANNNSANASAQPGVPGQTGRLPNPYAAAPTGRLPNPYATVNANATIEGAPVMYAREEPKEEKKPAMNSALQFHPRKQQKGKNPPRMTFSKPISAPPSSSPDKANNAPRKGYNDYLSTIDDDIEIDAARREQNRQDKERRKAAKKGKQQNREIRDWDTYWNSPYLISEPTPFEGYRKSRYRVMADQTWKDLLAQAAGVKRESSESSADSPASDVSDVAGGALAQPTQNGGLSGMGSPPLASIANSAIISGPPVHYDTSTTRISAPDVEMSDAPVQPARQEPKPKKKQYGKRIMEKYGYIEGKGLGAFNDGIAEPLELELMKRNSTYDRHKETMKKLDPIAVFKGGDRGSDYSARHNDQLGQPSMVLITVGLLDGVDLPANQQRSDGGIRQVIGDAFDKYGKIESITFDEETTELSDVPARIRFTDVTSAVRAVQDITRDDYTFRGNKVTVRYEN